MIYTRPRIDLELADATLPLQRRVHFDHKDTSNPGVAHGLTIENGGGAVQEQSQEGSSPGSLCLSCIFTLSRSRSLST